MSEHIPQRSPPDQEGDRVRPMVLFRQGLYWSLGAVATAATTAAAYAARDVLIRVLVALFLAISLDPAVRRLTHWHMRRGLAVLVVVLVTLGSVAAFLQAVIPAMVQQFHMMVTDFPQYVTGLQGRWASFRRITDQFHVSSQIESVLTSLPNRLGSGVFGATGRLFSAVLSTLTVAVFTVYFLSDLPRLRRGAVLLFPRARRDQVSRVVDVMVDKVGAYTSGNILISLVAGLAAFAALTALRVPLAVPLAFLVAVTDLIPTIGATLGAAICVLVALPTTPLWPNTVLLAVFFALYQLLENYVIAPRIMRKPIQLRPGAVLLASLIGGTALGLIGALMAIPIAAGVKVLISERIQAREEADTHEAADTHPTAPGDDETVLPPGGPS
jgi:predicted PurR-regulated permease PerM